MPDATHLIGSEIVNVRRATSAEKKMLYWYEDFTVIELQSGEKIFASRDEELNGPGELNMIVGRELFTIVLPRKR